MRIFLRIVSVVLLLAAAAWAAEIVHQEQGFDDGGPPMGALCMALPSFVFLFGGAGLWSLSNRIGE